MFKQNDIILKQGDCLELFETIEKASVDLILTDPPYGTIKGLENNLKGWDNAKINLKWDNTLDPKTIFKASQEILRPNGRLILFSQEPYTSSLLTQTENTFIDFNYRAVWVKNKFGNPLQSRKAMVSYFEDICIFTNQNPEVFYKHNASHPLRSYAKQVCDFIGLKPKQVNSILGHRKSEHFLTVTGLQFKFCTEATYNELIKVFKINEMKDFKTFKECRKIEEDFLNAAKDKTPVFNLEKQQNSKGNVLVHDKELNCVHPTQKPVALLEDLIKTYTNKGDTVLDFTMGSGSTAIACLNTDRKFIGFELDEEYFKIAQDRIDKHKSTK